MKKKVLIFAGTTEGRRLAELLAKYDVPLHICVATGYGEQVLPEKLAGCVTVGRLDAIQMEELIRAQEAGVIVDATHPYAVVVSENIRLAAENIGVERFRLLRESGEEPADPDSVLVDSVEEAAEYLKHTEGKALITTGSKELEKYTVVENYKERFIVRVLPTADVLAACEKMGFEGKNLIAMQGPFSEEMNAAMLRQIGASYLVTKESGKTGGFPEKARAAKRAGAKLILIRRPEQETGYTLAEVVEMLCPEALNEVKDISLISVKPRTITLLGIGMGAEEQMTLEGVRACRQADLMIGARRILAALKSYEKPVWEGYKSEEILRYIHEHPQYHRVVVAFSGDIGFYSGAKKLIESFGEEKVRLVCGISSASYFCSKLRIPWEDVKLLSLHGRYANLPACVRRNRRVFTLVGGAAGVHELCGQLTRFGFTDVRLWIGENLSYPEERIVCGLPGELSNRNWSGLCVALIENDAADQTVVTHGISDDEFVRDKTPMTKEEIRSISLSKLRLTAKSVVYDVGAGTGSVSVEAARQASGGTVYAIEKDEDALKLIRANAEKFGTPNLIPTPGTAPEAMRELPAPTHAFIGGSSGNLADILDMLREKNPDVRIVANAVTLETAAALTDYLKEHPPVHEDIVQVQTARAKSLASYHMMTAMNPVLIAAFDYREERK